jgi:type IV pilus assembly protein PilY1
MKMKTNHVRRSVAAAALAVAFLVPSQPAHTDDSELFAQNVPPNVLLAVDNSGSMNELVWHPDFNPLTVYSCNPGNGGLTANPGNWTTGSKSWTRCGVTRTLWADTQVAASGNSTRISFEYVNWLLSLPDGDPRLAEVNAVNDGTYSACLQAQGFTTYNRYRRARTTAAKDVLREVICNVNQISKVRFGLAEFRLSGGAGDPNGGFVRVPIKDYDTPIYTLPITTTLSYSGTHQQQLDYAINALEGETWTPLGETLFQLYTYFMSRDATERPVGVNGQTFPGYVYRTLPTGRYGHPGTGAEVPEDPVQFDCQKNFIVMITDGEPTKDDFTESNTADNTAQGFANFTGLIGDYNADGETEIQGADCVNPVGDKCALYLDDIAKFMQDTDARPDRPGTQVVDVYTVGFTTSPQANDLLSRTAAVGNGLFHSSNNAEELAVGIVDAISDIVQKSQSFTAATVPATRTADGGNIYTSLFLPQNDNPYWEGHLKLFNITADGDILDSAGNCALVNPTPPGECKGGVVSPTAPPYWDAAEEIPDPVTRKLYTSLPIVGRVPFNTALTVASLGDPAVTTDDLTLADIATYLGSGLLTVLDLKDAIIQNVRGCEFGSGVLLSPCVPRPWLLGDIFHSNPIVIGEPRSFVPEASYHAFAASQAARDKVIYAGANDGFLHAFHGGEMDTTPPPDEPPSYDRGTGTELFGFMPWPVRRNIRHLPKDTGSRDYYYVDGSPAAADVWIHDTPTQSAKAVDGSEWRTVLAGGLRQGGGGYYALDITDPASASYPDYMWEFPKEGAATSITNYMGETWAQPIMTKVKVVISGIAYERWVAIVTGGYHATGDPNEPLYNAAATAGRSIFIIDMKTGGILAEKKFDAAAPATDPRSQMLYAMPTTPSVLDLDGDEFADVIYVGDLGGNVWKWVVAHDPVNNNFGVDPINAGGSVDQPNWKFSKFFEAKATSSSPLGVTVGTTTYYKSIFYPPAATYKNQVLWLTFATGERANLKRPGDTTTTDENNRFYSVKDMDPLDRNGPYAAMNESTLFDSTDDGSCVSLTGFSGFFFRGRDGEKFNTNVEIFAYQVLAGSYMPIDSGNPCSSAGEGSLYVFNVYCGEGYFAAPTNGNPDGSATGVVGSSAGAPGESRRIDLGAGLPTDPRVTVSPTGTRVVVTQQDGEIENREGPPIDPEKLGQLYWREVTD